MRAYLEIDIEAGRDVIASAEFIRQVEGVKEAYAVSAHCDVYAVIEGSDFKSIYELVMRKIQVIRGVVDTRILPCVDLESEEEVGSTASGGSAADTDVN